MATIYVQITNIPDKATRWRAAFWDQFVSFTEILPISQDTARLDIEFSEAGRIRVDIASETHVLYFRESALMYPVNGHTYVWDCLANTLDGAEISPRILRETEPGLESVFIAGGLVLGVVALGTLASRKVKGR
ncbi:MAG: hypothetical protein PHZ19_07770 [Candidatus Thermoplasmatota archaeon]|nr:hypothetical protein [Candidatus Thermoplasmatota archaeon]